jgi:Tol biopolymer transport system component
MVDFFPLGNPTFPSWSPDGEVIILRVPVVDAAGTYRQILAIHAKDGSKQPIGSKRWSSLGQFQWLSNGSGLILTASDEAPGSPQQIWYLSYPVGEARKITNDLNDYVGVTLTADSRALATLQRDLTTSVWLIPVGDEQRAAQVTSSKYDGSRGIAFTPDGRVVYTSTIGANLGLSITDGKSSKQLTTDSSNYFDPAVSPDGRYVVFWSDRSGPGNIWRIGIDGSDLKQLTKGAFDQVPSFSSDGKWVLYTAVENGRKLLRQVSIEGGDPIPVGKTIAATGLFSPDGKYLLAADIDVKKMRWVQTIIPAGGGDPIRTFDNLPVVQRVSTNIRWSPNGRELTYVVTRAGVANIWSQPIDGGPARQLTDFKTGGIGYFDWSRDGKQLAITRFSFSSDIVLISDVN